MKRLHLAFVVLTGVVLLATPAMAMCVQAGVLMSCGQGQERSTASSCHEAPAPRDCCMMRDALDGVAPASAGAAGGWSFAAAPPAASGPEQLRSRSLSAPPLTEVPGTGNAGRYALFSAYLL